jgi:hypothetical protein
MSHHSSRSHRCVTNVTRLAPRAVHAKRIEMQRHTHTPHVHASTGRPTCGRVWPRAPPRLGRAWRASLEEHKTMTMTMPAPRVPGGAHCHRQTLSSPCHDTSHNTTIAKLGDDHMHNQNLAVRAWSLSPSLFLNSLQAPSEDLAWQLKTASTGGGSCHRAPIVNPVGNSWPGGHVVTVTCHTSGL